MKLPVMTIVRHAEHEGPGIIADWALEQGYRIRYVDVWDEGELPDPDDVGLLVLMGGPQAVYQAGYHPWMQQELAWLREVLYNTDAKVLGICLGSQLIAAALGAAVMPNAVKEIGWYPIFPVGDNVFAEEPVMVFHWHGDTFGLPFGAEPLFASEACANQGFSWGDDRRVIALQFHPEVTPDLVEEFIAEGEAELEAEGPFVMDDWNIRRLNKHAWDANALLVNILAQLQ